MEMQVPVRQDGDDIPAGLGQRDLNGARSTRPRLVTAGLADRRQDLIRHPTPERLGLGLPRGEDQIVDAALVDDVHLLRAAKGVHIERPPFRRRRAGRSPVSRVGCSSTAQTSAATNHV